jgi:ankyrin repeat protein
MNAFDITTVLSKIACSSIFFDKEGVETEIIGVNDVNWAGDSPIHIAAMAGDVDALIILLQAGADIHKRGEDEMTALHYAAMKNHADAIALLIKYEADPMLLDRNAKTPLMWATSLEKHAAIGALRRYTSSPQKKRN